MAICPTDHKSTGGFKGACLASHRSSQLTINICFGWQSFCFVGLLIGRQLIPFGIFTFAAVHWAQPLKEVAIPASWMIYVHFDPGPKYSTTSRWFRLVFFSPFIFIYDNFITASRVWTPLDGLARLVYVIEKCENSALSVLNEFFLWSRVSNAHNFWCDRGLVVAQPYLPVMLFKCAAALV